MRLPRLTLTAAVAASIAVAVTVAQAVAAAGPAPVVCSNRAAPPKLGGRPVALTGVYSWPTSTFYVRQVGTCVYVMGENNAGETGPQGNGFTSIFIGGIAPNLIVKGLWSDLPKGKITGSGTLVWKISEPGGVPTLTIVRSTGGWGASQLVRAPS